MLTKDAIYKQIDFLERSKDLCVSYEYISMMRMNAIKKGVLTTRDFYTDIADVYYTVKQTYLRQIAAIDKKDVQSKQRKKKNKVSVLLTADNKLYGDVLHKVFSLFVQDIQKQETDIIIVGNIGKQMFDGAKIGRDYTFVSLPHADSELTLADLKELVTQLAEYDKTDVYFGRYENYITQRGMSTNITGDVTLEEEGKKKEIALSYFEPSLEKIVHFFETQLFSALLKQSIYEGQLARYASRIGSMEEAMLGIKKEDAKMEMKKQKILALEKDKKQNERIVQLFYRSLS